VIPVLLPGFLIKLYDLINLSDNMQEAKKLHDRDSRNNDSLDWTEPAGVSGEHVQALTGFATQSRPSTDRLVTNEF
jgi:hypothetical protein